MEQKAKNENDISINCNKEKDIEGNILNIMTVECSSSHDSSCDFEESLEALHHSIDIKDEPEEYEVETLENLQSHLANQKITCSYKNEKAEAYECEICNKNFKCKKGLKQHLRIHTIQKLYACSICEKKYHNKTYLNYHLRIHTGEKPYRCRICEEKFSYGSSLRRHFSTCKGERYVCQICNSKFTQKGNLHIHLRIHTGEKPYECGICEKKFHCKPYLTTHLRIHTNKQHICETPNAKFTQKEDSKSRLRIPAIKKMFLCEICKKNLSSKDSLKRHTAIHTNQNRPIHMDKQCKICERKFSSSSSLWRHFRTCTGERYVCQICNSKFTQKGNLHIHLRIHTGEKPYECGICEKKFHCKPYLTTHLQSHTNS